MCKKTLGDIVSRKRCENKHDINPSHLNVGNTLLTCLLNGKYGCVCLLQLSCVCGVLGINGCLCVRSWGAGLDSLCLDSGPASWAPTEPTLCAKLLPGLFLCLWVLVRMYGCLCMSHTEETSSSLWEDVCVWGRKCLSCLGPSDWWFCWIWWKCLAFPGQVSQAMSWVQLAMIQLD